MYQTYWYFAAERQRIFFRRLEGESEPWTNDPILRQYRFTNAYRASDRVSQYLIRQVIYRDDLANSPTEVCFRILLFKLFNKIETWERLSSRFGPLTYEGFDCEAFGSFLDELFCSGESIYSSAYIMPPASSFAQARKHRNHMILLDRMMRDELPIRIADARSMQKGFELLRGYPSIGDFLAYQLITDINYSEIVNFSEREFVVPGPGARDGLSKCFASLGGLTEEEMIRFVADQQESEFDRLGLNFQDLWGRPLQLIDCQNLFCEVDKYARVRHPNTKGRSSRLHIKRKFRPAPSLSCYFYPPKWKLNERIPIDHRPNP